MTGHETAFHPPGTTTCVIWLQKRVEGSTGKRDDCHFCENPMNVSTFSYEFRTSIQNLIIFFWINWHQFFSLFCHCGLWANWHTFSQWFEPRRQVLDAQWSWLSWQSLHQRIPRGQVWHLCSVRAARKDGKWAGNMAGWNECMAHFKETYLMYTVYIYISTVDLFALAVIVLWYIYIYIYLCLNTHLFFIDDCHYMFIVLFFNENTRTQHVYVHGFPLFGLLENTHKQP